MSWPALGCPPLSYVIPLDDVAFCHPTSGRTMVIPTESSNNPDESSDWCPNNHLLTMVSRFHSWPGPYRIVVLHDSDNPSVFYLASRTSHRFHLRYS